MIIPNLLGGHHDYVQSPASINYKFRIFEDEYITMKVKREYFVEVTKSQFIEFIKERVAVEGFLNNTTIKGYNEEEIRWPITVRWTD